MDLAAEHHASRKKDNGDRPGPEISEEGKNVLRTDVVNKQVKHGKEKPSTVPARFLFLPDRLDGHLMRDHSAVFFLLERFHPPP
jgi:hypothetical protein